ncbi:MAG: hypothetical protein V1810_03870 [Candidatus Beckwithbacteria bacterium]
MDKQTVYLQLKELEKELVEAFAHFRRVFNEVADPRKQLSNQEIYDKLQGDIKEYHEEIEEIKKKTLEIMNKIQREYDQLAYQKILSNLEIKP